MDGDCEGTCEMVTDPLHIEENGSIGVLNERSCPEVRSKSDSSILPGVTRSICGPEKTHPRKGKGQFEYGHVTGNPRSTSALHSYSRHSSDEESHNRSETSQDGC